MTGLEFFPGWMLGDFRKSKEFKLMNLLEYRNTVMDLINSRIDTFGYNGKPVGITDRMLEASVLFNGFACLFTLDEGKTFQALPANPSENINSAGDWLFAYVYGANGFVKKVKLYLPGITENPSVSRGIGGSSVGKTYNGVLLRENATGYPFIYNISLSAKRLGNCMRAMDVALETMKVPYLIKCDETLKDSILKLYSKIRDNEPLIVGSKGLDLQAIEVLDTKVDPSILSEFREQYNFLQSDIQNKMGSFHNAQPDKNAHILEDELHSDDQDTENQLQKSLTYREKFCEEVNEAFGINMSVYVKDKRITGEEVEGGKSYAENKENDL